MWITILILGSAYCSILDILRRGLNIDMESNLESISREPNPAITTAKIRNILLSVKTDFWRKDFDIRKNPIKSPRNHSKRNDLCIKPPTMAIIIIKSIVNALRFLTLIPASCIIGKAAKTVTITKSAIGP